MAYRPGDYQSSDDPDDPDPVATSVARALASAPPLTRSQLRTISSVLNHHEGATSR